MVDTHSRKEVMHEIVSHLVTTGFAVAAFGVPCIIADIMTGTAFWQAGPNGKVSTMSTLNNADRFDIFPADDDEMNALAELAAPNGDWFGIHILSDAELAELADEYDYEYDYLDDADIADYLADVYGSVFAYGYETDYAD